MRVGVGLRRRGGGRPGGDLYAARRDRARGDRRHDRDDADDHDRDWLDTDAFDASVLDAPDQRLALDPDGPWAAARRFARALARATSATVALYVTDFWGGDCEVADGWVFDGDREVGYHQAPFSL